ncbi:SDR family oxidoreductase [Dehalobacter sp. DCM]|uniref:SDR family NAD(P)-dependent oxidoreductase n=1 Tax=Dehalobacter sp. DCM TaxID=2907827 RepID=UPI0030818BD9|nr:SDR family oxidoreductase [Dehalobacter sp. DCM]
MSRLEGKIAFITGAGSGIGRGSAKMFAREGAKVICADFNEAWGEETAKAINDAGGDAIFVKCNVRNRQDIKDAVKAGMDKYGRIDVLMNCAGIVRIKPFIEITEDDYIAITETNLRGYIWTMQEILPIMMKQNKGSIVNVASISAYKAETRTAVYAATKAGVTMMSQDIAKEVASNNIRVNCICPGPVGTNMTPEEIRNHPEIVEEMVKELVPLGREGRPDDIAYAAVYLASDESSWVTGTSVIVDGGVWINTNK